MNMIFFCEEARIKSTGEEFFMKIFGISPLIPSSNFEIRVW